MRLVRARGAPPQSVARQGTPRRRVKKKPAKPRSRGEKNYPYVAYWIHTYSSRHGREFEPVYVLGTVDRPEEGIVGYDLRARPVRLGEGAYTMVISPEDVRSRPY